MSMARLTLDGRRIEAPEGSNVLLVALEHGVYIPHFCFHPALSAPANCRMCLVEIETSGKRELTTACDARVVDGMVVDTRGEAVAQARQAVMEFLLVDHPLDCPVCDKAGECELQDHAHAYGRGAGRFSEVKVRRGTKQIGQRVVLYADRCIGCTRCVRFCDEITGTGELSIFRRGARAQVDIFPGARLDNRMSGNVVDLCPVGALVDEEFRFQPPVWRLRGVDSICPGCSAGCSVRVDVHAERVHRLKPRVNLEVNQYWMCDDGRYGWRYVHSPWRLSAPLVKQGNGQVPASWEEALKRVTQKLTRGYEPQSVVAILSGGLTNEENYLLARLAREVWKTRQAGLRRRLDGEGDVRFEGGFTIRADRTPNARGAREVAAGLELELLDPDQIWQGMEDGRIRAAYLLGGHPGERLQERERQALAGLELLVVQDMLDSELTRLADVVLPGVSPFEKDGTFTNADGRVQRVRQAIPPRPDALPDWQILQRLGAAGPGWDFAHPRQIMDEMGQHLGGRYAGLTYERLEAGEPDRRRRRQAYGGGWAAQMQGRGFIHVEDHGKWSSTTE